MKYVYAVRATGDTGLETLWSRAAKTITRFAQDPDDPETEIDL